LDCGRSEFSKGNAVRIHESGVFNGANERPGTVTDHISATLCDLAAGSWDCGLRMFTEAAKSEDLVRDLFASKSASDVFVVWCNYSAGQVAKGFDQARIGRDLYWNAGVALGRAVGMLPPLTSGVSTDGKCDVTSPEQEVMLLHVIE
jgi:hypothetical protein